MDVSECKDNVCIRYLQNFLPAARARARASQLPGHFSWTKTPHPAFTNPHSTAEACTTQVWFLIEKTNLYKGSFMEILYIYNIIVRHVYVDDINGICTLFLLFD